MRHLLRLTLVALAVAGFLLSPVPAQESAPQDGPAMEAPPDSTPTDEPRDWQASLDRRMKSVNEAVGNVFFFPIPVPGTANTAAKGAPVMPELPRSVGQVLRLLVRVVPQGLLRHNGLGAAAGAARCVRSRRADPRL